MNERELQEFFQTRRVIEDYVLEHGLRQFSFWTKTRASDNFWTCLERDGFSLLAASIIADAAYNTIDELGPQHHVLSAMLRDVYSVMYEVTGGMTIEELV